MLHQLESRKLSVVQPLPLEIFSLDSVPMGAGIVSSEQGPTNNPYLF